MAVVAGIDGCPSGWLCLTKDLATGTIQARIQAIHGDKVLGRVDSSFANPYVAMVYILESDCDSSP